jgi:putative hydrolase of the HAD superfamily
MSIKFIYFDLDDTITDHHIAARHTLIDLYNDYIKPLANKPTIEQFIAVYEKINRGKWQAYANNELSKDEVKYGRFRDTAQALGLKELPVTEMSDQFLSISQKYWQWIDGAEAVFKKLASQIPCGIITNGFSEVQEIKFNHFSIADFADPLIVSEEFGSMKPDPELFHYAASLVGRSSDEILYVGDSLASDVYGATNAGWKVAWYNPNGNDLPTDFNKADLVYPFKEFSELPKIIASL